MEYFHQEKGRRQMSVEYFHQMTVEVSFDTFYTSSLALFLFLANHVLLGWRNYISSPIIRRVPIKSLTP